MPTKQQKNIIKKTLKYSNYHLLLLKHNSNTIK